MKEIIEVCNTPDLKIILSAKAELKENSANSYDLYVELPNIAPPGWRGTVLAQNEKDAVKGAVSAANGYLAGHNSRLAELVESVINELKKDAANGKVIDLKEAEKRAKRIRQANDQIERATRTLLDIASRPWPDAE